MKKLLSILLCLALLAGLCMLPVLAAETPEGTDGAETVPAEEAAEDETLPPELEGADAEPGPEAQPESSGEEFVPVTGAETTPGSGGNTGSEPEVALASAPDLVLPVTPTDLTEGDTDVIDPDQLVTSGHITDTGIHWSFEDGVLTLSGAGLVPDFPPVLNEPWWYLKSEIERIVVEESITELGANFAPMCAKLRFVELCEGLTDIGKGSFSGDGALTEINMPARLITIGEEAFFRTGLTEIDLPDGLEVIGQHAFAESQLTEVTIPGSVTDLGRGAFHGCGGLKRVVIEDGVTEVPEVCFFGCKELTSLVFSRSLESLEANALAGTGLKELSLTEDGYEMVGFLDEYGDEVTLEQCVSGSYEGKIYPLWLRAYTGFTDVDESAWYADSVRFCYRLELMNGMTETIFDPRGTGTRAQAVTILYRLAGEPEISGPSTLKDVKTGVWYSDAVAWATETGITKGYEDGTFRPSKNVTRQEFVTFMCRFAAYMRYAYDDDVWEEEYLKDFPDKDKVATWAQSAESWSVAVGLQSGSLDSSGKRWLNPTSNVTRAELATYLRNFCVELPAISLLSIVHGLMDYPVIEFIDIVGEPVSRDYEPYNEDPSIYLGYWQYDGYVLLTYRLEDGNEYILGVDIT